MSGSTVNPRLERMIEDQLKRRGIDEPDLLKAFRANPRHLFVSENQRQEAYSDRPLPIGEGQTISQPYIVALMTKSLSVGPEDSVLEVGTGSGYQTAILASLAKEVYTVERLARLQQGAKRRLKKLGRENVSYKVGDGTLGWEEHAPYDRIIGTGSVPEVPDDLIEQLSDPGRLVIPAGKRRQQRLVLLLKEEGELTRQKRTYCSFLPLIGKEGWKS